MKEIKFNLNEAEYSAVMSALRKYSKNDKTSKAEAAVAVDVRLRIRAAWAWSKVESDIEENRIHITESETKLNLRDQKWLIKEG